MEFFLVFLLTAVCHLRASANSGYLVVTPSVFRANTEEVLSVAILNASTPIAVEAKLYNRKGELVTSAGHEIFGRGTLKLKIPDGAKGHYTLKVCGNCLSSKGGLYSFYNSTSVNVEEKSASVFIQTDKPIYKAGQEVLINFITTGPDLKPVEQKLSAYLLDPRGTRVIQWNKLNAFCCGLLRTSYQLSSRPPLGAWNVVVELQGQVYKKSFDVEKYVLPKFEVTVRPPRFITNWEGCEKVIVEAKYTYGAAVSGKMTVKIQITGSDYYEGTDSTVITKTTQIHGTVAVNVCVLELVDVEELGDHFRGHLSVEAEVKTSDGLKVAVTDSSCPVSRQPVEIEFAKDVRKYFRPGFPYTGKLLVLHPDGSAANDIMIQIQSEVNKGSIAIENYVSHDGFVQFNIPAIPTDAHSVWISAKVINDGKKRTRDSYLPTYLSITSWYSPSNCHLMIESLQTEALTIGSEAKARIHSTCSCGSIKLYYEVVSKGNIVHSGVHFARRVTKRSSRRKTRFLTTADDEQENGSRACNMSFKFPIMHEMAPSSRLIVYYIRADGEAVADVTTIFIQPEFKNKMSLKLSRDDVRPGDSVAMTVRSQPGSCFCVGAIDKSIHLLKPGHQLSAAEIFQELGNYDTSVNEDSEDMNLWPRVRGRKRRSFNDFRKMLIARDSLSAFEEAGLMVMTDSASFQFEQDLNRLLGWSVNEPRFGRHQVASLSSSARSTKRKNKRTEKRTYFPETWIWTCFNSSETQEEKTLNFTAPDTVTSWMLDGISLSSSHGLGLLESPIVLRTFKPFFADLNLPYSVIRNEQARIPVVVHNYMPSCVMVNLTVSVSTGITTISVPRDKSFCLATDQSETFDLILVFTLLGLQNISVEALAYEDSRCCSRDLSSRTEGSSFTLQIDSDQLQRQVLVEAEGIARFYTRSVFFCPSERIYLSTPNSYDFQYVEVPQSWQSATFAVRASNDVHLALSFIPEDNEGMYEIVIGGYLNTHSWISKGKFGKELVLVTSPDILSGNEFRSFWVSWDLGQIKVGLASLELLSLQVDQLLMVRYLGYTTGWGSTGDFKLWTKHASAGDVFHLMLPNSVVEGSGKATVSVISDILGPTMVNLGQLLRLPSGCGEQNMIHFAPNVYILRYLQAVNQMTTDMEIKATTFLREGYQTQLTYRRSDGSYSAFGDKDSSGNLWLTAFVLKSFIQAKSFIFIDDAETERSLSWLLSHQNPDGSFSQTGRFINKVIQGGSHGQISLTAYVATVLIATDRKVRGVALAKAQSYLESQIEIGKRRDPYTTALVSYALTLLKSSLSGMATRNLSNLAIIQNGMMFWENRAFNENGELWSDMNSEFKVSSADVETAGYALLTYIERRDFASAMLIIKWLSLQRNALGGFSSTQDTCVALFALSEFASQTFGESVNLTVDIASVNMDLHERVDVTDDTSKILQQVTVPTLPTVLFLRAVGEGCALLQVEVSYNIPNPDRSPAFSLTALVTKSESKDVHDLTGEIVQPSRHKERSMEYLNAIDGNESGDGIARVFSINLRICTRWLHPGSSNMALMEVALPSGFIPDSESLELLLESGGVKQFETKERLIHLYFDEIPSACKTCISLTAYRNYEIGKTHPVPIKIYDYYEPVFESSILYSLDNVFELMQEICPRGLCSQNDSTINDLPASGTNQGCDPVWGCATDADPHVTRTCSCDRDCPIVGRPVCGSDGSIYPNWCQMETVACRTSRHIEVMPMLFCDTDDETISEAEFSEVPSSRISDSQTPSSDPDQLLRVKVPESVEHHSTVGEEKSLPVDSEDYGDYSNEAWKHSNNLEDSDNTRSTKVTRLVRILENRNEGQKASQRPEDIHRYKDNSNYTDDQKDQYPDNSTYFESVSSVQSALTHDESNVTIRSEEENSAVTKNSFVMTSENVIATTDDVSKESANAVYDQAKSSDSQTKLPLVVQDNVTTDMSLFISEDFTKSSPLDNFTSEDGSNFSTSLMKINHENDSKSIDENRKYKQSFNNSQEQLVYTVFDLDVLNDTRSTDNITKVNRHEYDLTDSRSITSPDRKLLPTSSDPDEQSSSVPSNHDSSSEEFLDGVSKPLDQVLQEPSKNVLAEVDLTVVNDLENIQETVDLPDEKSYTNQIDFLQSSKTNTGELIPTLSSVDKNTDHLSNQFEDKTTSTLQNVTQRTEDNEMRDHEHDTAGEWQNSVQTPVGTEKNLDSTEVIFKMNMTSKPEEVLNNKEQTEDTNEKNAEKRTKYAPKISRLTKDDFLWQNMAPVEEQGTHSLELAGKSDFFQKLGTKSSEDATHLSNMDPSSFILPDSSAEGSRVTEITGRAPENREKSSSAQEIGMQDNAEASYKTSVHEDYETVTEVTSEILDMANLNSTTLDSSNINNRTQDHNKQLLSISTATRLDKGNFHAVTNNRQEVPSETRDSHSTPWSTKSNPLTARDSDKQARIKSGEIQESESLETVSTAKLQTQEHVENSTVDKTPRISESSCNGANCADDVSEADTGTSPRKTETPFDFSSSTSSQHDTVLDSLAAERETAIAVTRDDDEPEQATRSEHP